MHVHKTIGVDVAVVETKHTKIQIRIMSGARLMTEKKELRHPQIKKR
jgi:hypothetical protein